MSASTETSHPAESGVTAGSAGPGEYPGRLDPAEVELGVELAGLALANPVLSASGCFASGREADRFFDISRLGAVVVKSLTLEPRDGLPTPRMAETASGMLNAIGLQNPGIDRWLADDLPWLAARGVTTVASIAGNTVEEYRALGRRLRGVNGVAAIEANISCPNVADRNTIFACSPEATGEAVTAVVDSADKPVLAKLTPDVTDVTAIAAAARDAGAAGVSAVNTLLGMAIDPDTARPRLAAGTGGLSGPAMKPVAVRAVHQVHQAMPELPILAQGGARSAADVAEFLQAGARAVACGTATFGNPAALAEVLETLPHWLAERGWRRASQLHGAAVG